MQCKICGNELGEGDKFCPKCGSGQIIETAQAVDGQETIRTSETDSAKSGKSIIREENRREVKNPVNWIFVFIGLAIQIITDRYCCHFLNAEWLAGTIGSLLPSVLVSLAIATMLVKKDTNGKRNVNSVSFRTFSIIFLILSIILVIGKFYGN